MHYFQKISAPFGRSTPKQRLVDTGIYSSDWVEMFDKHDIKMHASEKIDGTSVGIKWDGNRVSFVGHTDKSQFCPRYLDYLKSTFGTPEFESVIEEICGEDPVTFFGEGISKDYNAHYGFPEGNFVMYDVQVSNGKYLNRDSVIDIASKLGLLYPHEEMMTIKEAIEFVKKRPASFLNPDWKLEGLVLRPPMELYGKDNRRLLCKVKVRDFAE